MKPSTHFTLPPLFVLDPNSDLSKEMSYPLEKMQIAFDGAILGKRKIKEKETTTVIITFAQAIKHLGKMIGYTATDDVNEIFKPIIRELVEYAKALIAGNSIDFDAYPKVLAFIKWAHALQNTHLVWPETGFPANLFYTLIERLRNLSAKNELPNEAIVLHFLFDGLNAHCINGNKTPGYNFIASARAAEFSIALEKLGARSQKTELFYDLMPYIQTHRALEAGITQLKQNPIYKTLASQGILSYTCIKNEKTGANSYQLREGAIENGKNFVLTAVSNGLKDACQTLADKINTITTALTEGLKNLNSSLNQNPNKEKVYTMALWDTSEWVMHLYVALQVLAKLDSSYEKNLNEFKNNIIISDILDRNNKGDYPANYRDEELRKTKVGEFFTHEKVTEHLQHLQQQETERAKCLYRL